MMYRALAHLKARVEAQGTANKYAVIEEITWPHYIKDFQDTSLSA
jgi:hypothetical protein